MKALLILAVVFGAFWYGVVSFNAPRAKELTTKSIEHGKKSYDTFAPKVSAKVSKMLRESANKIESKSKQVYDTLSPKVSAKVSAKIKEGKQVIDTFGEDVKLEASILMCEGAEKLAR